jgi:hypothetical protein
MQASAVARPLLSPVHSTDEWWHYCYNRARLVVEKNKRWRWEYIRERARSRDEYISLYKKMVMPDSKGYFVTVLFSNMICSFTSSLMRMRKA